MRITPAGGVVVRENHIALTLRMEQSRERDAAQFFSKSCFFDLDERPRRAAVSSMTSNWMPSRRRLPEPPPRRPPRPPPQVAAPSPRGALAAHRRKGRRKWKQRGGLSMWTTSRDGCRSSWRIATFLAGVAAVAEFMRAKRALRTLPTSGSP